MSQTHESSSSEFHDPDRRRGGTYRPFEPWSKLLIRGLYIGMLQDPYEELLGCIEGVLAMADIPWRNRTMRKVQLEYWTA